MKKSIKLVAFIAALAMLATLATCVAFAAGSKTSATEVTVTKDGQVQDSTIGAIPDGIPPLTAEIASKALGIPAEQLKVVWQQDVTTTAEAPYTVKVNLEGTSGYVFHWENGAWAYKGSTGTDINMTLSPVGVVVKTDAGTPGTTPATGDNNLYLAIACGAVALVGVVGTCVTVALKKKAK